MAEEEQELHRGQADDALNAVHKQLHIALWVNT